MFLSALSAAATFLVSQSAATELAQAERTRLNTCLTTIETDPEAAYEDALAWLSEGARPLARQCAALALIGLGNEEEGAARLEALANAPDAGSIADRTVYLAQAGNAWMAAGLPKEAAVTLANAVRLSPDDPALRKDLASANMLLGLWESAITELDTAADLAPGDAETLRLRAQAKLGRGEPDEAMKDIEAAMIADPQDIDVLVLRGEVREALRLAELD